ncbi:MAG: transcriptional repressor [Bacteroidaceae bacterium]|nr:transcriptional repressor [Bacteroidaceae bacterium]
MVGKKNNIEEKEKAKQQLTDYLTKRKFRKTPERYAILDMIYTIKGHFSIETLYTMMEDVAKFRVSRATIYNTLILLLDAHLVIKHQFGSSTQFEKCYNQGIHHHMICTQCGKVTEFQDEQLQAAVVGTKLPRFKQINYSLYIYGLCSKCQWKLSRMLAANKRAQEKVEEKETNKKAKGKKTKGKKAEGKPSIVRSPKAK